MTVELTLEIQSVEKTFECTVDGYVCLDEVWEDFDLRAREHPIEWLESEDAQLIESGHVMDLTRFNGGIWANKRACYSYIAWLDFGLADNVFGTIDTFAR